MARQGEAVKVCWGMAGFGWARIGKAVEARRCKAP